LNECEFFICWFNSREVDRNLDELTVLKHEKLEIEKRLRRLKFEKSNNPNSNNVKKMATLIREKDLNSSDNESPDESDGGMSFPILKNIEFQTLLLESTKNDDDISITNDPAAVTADDQDIETIDETKIDDLDKRLTLVTRKYTLIKRRVIDKHCRTRGLHLGQDRYRRRYWYFSHLPGIYVEGLTSGDISPNDIRDTVQNAAKQKLDKTGEVNSSSSRPSQRKKQPTRVPNATTPPPSINSTEQLTPIELNKIKTENSDNEEEQQQINSSDNLATMDLSAFCLAANRDNNEDNGKEEELVSIKTEPSEELVNKRDVTEMNDDNLPLDLSCSKPKRSCEDDYWALQHKQAAYPLPSTLNKFDQFKELNDLATTAILLNNIKQETIASKNILDLTNANQMMSSFKQESSTTNFKQIEQTIREKFQYSQPLPIPDGKYFTHRNKTNMLYCKRFFDLKRFPNVSHHFVNLEIRIFFS
jgi:hypothetical protein